MLGFFTFISSSYLACTVGSDPFDVHEAHGNCEDEEGGPGEEDANRNRPLPQTGIVQTGIVHSKADCKIPGVRRKSPHL